MRKKIRRTLKWVTFVYVLFVIAHAVVYASNSYLLSKPTKIPGATPVTNETCALCHEDKMEITPLYHADCELCHGGGSLHIDVADDQKARTIAVPSDETCLKCHEERDDEVFNWQHSEHKKAGLICADCHNPHSKDSSWTISAKDPRFRSMDPQSALCLRCHEEKLSKINLPSHHPIIEGAVSCVDCHDPHDNNPATNMFFKNETCFKCHQRKQGPWAVEHPPVTEDCTICHDPHGSVNRSLLNVAEPTLCLQCHSLPDDRHNNNAGLTSLQLMHCTSCHGAIHGTHENLHLMH